MSRGLYCDGLCLNAHEVVLGLPLLDLLHVALDAVAHGPNQATEVRLGLLSLAQTSQTRGHSVDVIGVDALQILEEVGLTHAGGVRQIAVDQVTLKVSGVVSTAAELKELHGEREH